MASSPAFTSLLALSCWSLIIAIDTTSLSVALPTIAKDFNASTVQIYWAVTGFVLSSAVFQPIFASLSTFSRKTAILTALTFFTIGVVVSSFAHNITVLIAGQCIRGIGGGGLLVLTSIVMEDIFTIEEQPRYERVIYLVWLFGSCSGPILGGGFAQYVTWRWIFWFTLPLCGIGIVVVLLFFPSNSKVEQWSWAGLKKVDWVDIVLFAGSIAAFLMAISWGGVTFAWSAWQTIVPLVLGIAGLFGWLIYSCFLSSNPMIPTTVIWDITARINYLGILIEGLIQSGLLYSLPVYYQALNSYTPLVSALALLPQLLSSSLASAVTRTLITRTQRIKIFVVYGWIILAFGMALLYLLDSNSRIYVWVLINIPSGIGLGILFPSLGMATMASAQRRAVSSNVEERAQVETKAARLDFFFLTLGQAVGIVVGQAIFTNQVARILGPSVSSNAAILVEEMRGMARNDARKPPLISAFLGGLRNMWWFLFALAAILAVMTLFSADYAVEKKNLRKEVKKDVEKGVVKEVEQKSSKGGSTATVTVVEV